MMKSELLRESKAWEKIHPSERYYEPNFPVFRAEDCAKFEALCEEMAETVASLFAKRSPQMERAFRSTGLPKRGWEFSDITQCIYANIQRSARTLLEQRGLLSPPQKHKNGADWIYWAEEPPAELKTS
jgi:hypothetical protein